MNTDMYYGAPPALFRTARILRRKMTRSERLLWKRLHDNKLNGLKFRRQHPIYKYIVDFYCHSHKLIIELDGEYHFKPGQKLYDNIRDKELKEFGLTVLRFTDSQVYSNIDFVIKRIITQIEESPL